MIVRTTILLVAAIGIAAPATVVHADAGPVAPEAAVAADPAATPATPATPLGDVSRSGIAVDSDYRISKEDVLQLSVWGEPALQGVYLHVTPEGTMSVPVVGSIRAEGQTLEQARDEIARRFTEMDYLRDPIVQLTLYQMHSMKIRVLGQVQRPGLINMREGDTVVQAIAEAGGFLVDTAGLASATITRIGVDKPIPVDLDAVYYENDQSQDMALKNGDTIYIPEDTENRYYVTGLVQRPSVYPLKKTTTVTQAITQAGGPIQRAALGRTVVIRKGVEGQEAEKIPVDVAKILDGDVSKDFRLQPGDVVLVPETKTPDLNKLSQFVGVLFNLSYLDRIGFF